MSNIRVVKKQSNITIKREKALKKADLQAIEQNTAKACELIANQKQLDYSELLSKLADELNKLPHEIASKIDFSVPEPINNTSQLETLQNTLTSLVAAVKAQKQVDTKQTEKTLLEVLRTLETISKKETQVLVEQKSIELPREAKDAIPVVLVDKDRKNFYDSIQQFFSGGGFPTRLTVGDSVKVANADGSSVISNELEQAIQNIDRKTQEVDSPAIDAFGRQRVADPYTIFDSKMVTDKQPLFFDEVLNGTALATYNDFEASVTMSVAANGDYAIRQTFMRFDYQPAKSQRLFLTGILGSPVANTEARIGYFNTSTDAPYTANRDGIYFGVDSTSAYVAVSINGTETKIPQSQWNTDRLDGTGASGITLDLDTVQIFTIDFEWLGVGRIRYGFVVDGLVYYCHYENHANVTGETTVYMSSPNHSIRYEVYSTGGSKQIKQICSSVQSEGGVEPTGITRSISRGITTVSRGTTLGGLLFFRLKATNSCTTTAPVSFSTLCTSNNAANYRYAMLFNPVVAGTALTWIPIANSAVEFAIAAADNTITGGVELLSGYASGREPSVALPTNLIINPGVALNGTRDIFCLAVQTIAGSDSFVGSINIREVTCG